VDATAIIQVRPDRTTVELLLAEEPEFATFLSILAGDEWMQDRGKRAVGARTHSYAPSVVKLRAADSRRKAAAAKAAGGGAPEVTPVSTPVDSVVENPTPAERGARAAAAAKRGDAGQVWGSLSNQHEGSSRGKRVGSSTRGRTAVTVRAAVLGTPGRPEDGEPPF
jgi:hypothetical protein